MKKRILFILNSLTAGGAEKQTISLINELNEGEFELSLIYFDPVDTLLSQIDLKKLTLLECLYRKKRLDWRLIKRIKQIILTKKFDIVVCVEQYPMIYAFMCRLLIPQRYKIVKISHSTVPTPDIWTRLKNLLLYRHLMDRCEKVVFVCHNQMIYWFNRFSISRSNSTYIYNGIDVRCFSDTCTEKEKHRIRTSFGFKPSDFIVGICAALRPEKQHKDFVDAIKLAQNRIPEIKGLIIGDGIVKNDLYCQIEKNKMSSAIKLTGFQDDTRPYVSICDCMVLTSHAVESFSISALESMAMGKPMIMTDLGGAKEMIEHGISGFIYEKGDIKQLAEYLFTMKQNKNYVQMGTNARKRVCSSFSTEKMIDKYVDLFSSIK